MRSMIYLRLLDSQRLFIKLKAQIFDAADTFEFEYDPNTTTGVEYRVVTKKALQPLSDVFLIDHAWTTTADKAREQLRTIPHLLQRMARLTGVDDEADVTDEEKTKALVDKVWQAMWRFNHTYTVNTAKGDQMTMWYVMDEAGSWITHSDEPNFMVKPIFWLYAGIAYTLMWPIKPLAEEEAVTRDFLLGVTQQRRERFIAFFDDDRREVLAQLIEEEHAEATKHQQPQQVVQAAEAKKEGDDAPASQATKAKGKAKLPLKLFTPYKLVRAHLTRKEFVIEDNINLANIWWLYDRIKDFAELKNTDSGQQPIYVNQFPNDACITVKDLLAETVRGVLGEVPWLPLTYNLETQLAAFIADFHGRQEKNEDNVWIVKPWNLTRTMGHLVTNDIGAIVRQIEVGPRVVQKYISRPFLIDQKKFDMRFLVLVKSIEPLEIYLYNVFYLRCANVPYSLEDFENFQKHFTIMNYIEGAELKQIPDSEFIPEYNRQMPHATWQEAVQPKIHQLILQVFQAAKATKNGIRHLPNCRAIYGLDLMVDADGQPLLLEVNYNPDTTKICKWSPSFWNDALAVLFLDEDKWRDAGAKVTRLS